ncbi:MAG: TonB-dependent receptor domain-containing protein [Terriglobia bacterium]
MRQIARCLALLLVGALIALMATVAPAWAATQNALLTGSVYDSNGSPIPGATVRLINAGTGFSQGQTSDSDGNYTFAAVPPAEGYVLSVEATGFATEIRQDLEITVGDNKLVLPPFLLQPTAPAAVAAPPSQPAAPAPTTAQPAPTVPTQPTAPKPAAEQPSQPPPPTTPAVQPATPPMTPPAAVKAIRVPTVSLELVSTTLGGVIDSRTVRTLPLAGRDFIDLALLVPGTYPVEQGSALEGASLVVNGVRANMNNFLLDGVDNNDYTINQSLPFQIVEAMQEFRVQSSTSAAEYGRTGGAQINTISRSGSNALHGTLFEFNRNSGASAQNALSAYRGGSFDAFAQKARGDFIEWGPDPYDQDACANLGICGTFYPTPVLSDRGLRRIYDSGREPRINQNQFGANVGGALIKNKAFFFLNWESFRATNPRPDFERVPANFYRDPANAFDESSSRGIALLNLYPAPNVPTSTVVDAFGDPVSDPNGFSAFAVGDARNFTNSDNFLERIDTRFGDKVTMSFKHNIQAIRQVQGGAVPRTPNYDGSGIDLRGRNQNFSYNYVHRLSERTVNELRLGWNRFRLTTMPLDRTGGAFDLFQNLNFLNGGMPSVLIGGFENTFGPFANLGANFTAPGNRANNLWSVADNWSRTSGKHALKFGGEVRYNRLDVNNQAMGRGLVTFFDASFASLGEPDLASIARVSSDFGGGFDRSFRATSYDLFVQDTWRPATGVTVNFGVRYEINQAPVEARDRLVNNYPGACPDLVCLVRSGTNTIMDSEGTAVGGSFAAPRAGFDTDFNNFSPQVGFAWAPGKSRKTVFRGAYALAYDQQPVQASANMLLNPPSVQQWVSFYPLVLLSDTFPAGFPSVNVADFDVDGDGFISTWLRQPYSITARDPNTRSSYVHQFNFGIQRQLGNSSAFELAYVSSLGHKLPRLRLSLACTPNQFSIDLIPCFPAGFRDVEPGAGLLSDSIVNQENSTNSNFHSMFARWETRALHGITVRLHYQWAHSIDTASAATPPVFLFSPTTAALVKLIGTVNVDQFAALNNANPTLSLRPGLPTINTRALLPNDTTNNPNLAGERASSDFDARHRFVAHFMYDLPRWQRASLLGIGWQLAGIVTVQSAQPFTVFADSFGVPLRPNITKMPVINNNNPDAAIDGGVPAGCNVDLSVYPCTGTSAVSAFDLSWNQAFYPGRLPRNAFRGPALANFDFSVLKNTYFGRDERMNLQFRAEFFNLFNNVNYLLPFSQEGQFVSFPGYSGYLIANPFFGQILQARPPRQVQFALKFVF